jgi:formylglycine-generating enzyme required for sulfatase activity
MQRRTFMQNLAAGGASLAASVNSAALPALSGSTGVKLPPLQEYAFNTVRVDRHGRTLAVERRVTRFFDESLGGFGDDIAMVAVPLDNAARAPFFLARTPVTQAQWRAVAGLPRMQRDLDPAPACFIGDAHPVECVSWYDAEEFCARLTAYTGRPYRLPREVEWERACRAGSSAPFAYGPTLTGALANYGAGRTYAAEAPGVSHRATTPVGQFAPNRHGLNDMHGNVWEWCADPWHGDAQSGAVSDARRGADPQWRVLRGGSWADAPDRLRSASRTGNRAAAFNRIIGLRLALSFPAA